MIDWKEWYEQMPSDFRQYLKTRYQEIRAELRNDPQLGFGERQFLVENLNECSSLLRQVMANEEAEK